MSPRAAWRLESLGFTQVFDYVAGKAEWFAFGLPREGQDATIPRAGDRARRDVLTCGPTDRLGAVREQLSKLGTGECVVINEHRVVLGRLRNDRIDASDDTRVLQVMEPGPTTIRPDTRLDAIAKRMRERGVSRIIVTTPDGRLGGVLYRDDAER